MEHIVLLGDSILDNTSYVMPHSPLDVVTQLKAAVGARGWEVTQRARDGAVMRHVRDSQTLFLPQDATILVLSVGGNDGLGVLPRLRGDFVGTVSTFFSAFRVEYEALLDQLIATHALPLIVCTIYKPQFPGWLLWLVSGVGLRLINRIICDAARARNLPILDLWEIFDQRADFANAIEPGVPGGHKIVKNLVAMIEKGDHRRPVMYTDASYDLAFDLTGNTRFDTARFAGTAATARRA